MDTLWEIVTWLFTTVTGILVVVVAILLISIIMAPSGSRAGRARSMWSSFVATVGNLVAWILAIIAALILKVAAYYGALYLIKVIDHNLLIYYWAFYGLVPAIIAFFILRNISKLAANSFALAYLVAGIAAFHLHDIGTVAKNEFRHYSECIRKNNCLGLTAKPSTPSYGSMLVTIRPGEESVAVVNYQNSHLVWSLTRGRKFPNVYHLVGNEDIDRSVHDPTAGWQHGCRNNAWSYKFYLPRSAPNPVTVLVQRKKGPAPRGPWGAGCDTV